MSTLLEQACLKMAEQPMEKEAADKSMQLAKLVSFAPNLKLMHTLTKSYGMHKSLDKAYAEIGDNMDTLCECCLGTYPDMKIKREALTFEYPATKSDMLPATRKLEKEFITISDPIVKGDEVLGDLQRIVLANFRHLFYWLSLKD